LKEERRGHKIKLHNYNNNLSKFIIFVAICLGLGIYIFRIAYVGTEIWVANMSAHKIYQNGDKFMGQEIQKKYV